jgi:hypothetical protein
MATKPVSSDDLRRVMQHLGRLGGKASQAAITDEERRERCRKAGKASAEARKRKKSPPPATTDGD